MICARCIMLIIFLFITKALRQTIASLFGEETGITYLLIIGLQGYISMSASRLLLDNYAIIIGSICMILLINRKYNQFGIVYALWLI